MKKLNIIDLYKIIGIGILILFCVGISYYGHFVLHSHLFFTHLFYIPIIIGSLWWGHKSLFIPVVLALSLIVMHYLSTDLSFPVTSVLKICMFFLISFLISFQNQKLKSLFKQQKTLSRSLEKEIGERKLTENALRESNIKFSTIADNNYDWEYWIDQNGTYVYVSQACEKITGYTPDKFISNSRLIYEITHPEYRNKVSVHYLKESDENHHHYSMEFIIIRADGEERWIEHNCNPVFDNSGNFIGRRGNNRDITGIKRMLFEKEKSENKYKDLVELANVAIAQDNKNGNIVYFNKQFEELFGYTSEEIIKLSHDDLVHPDDKEWVTEFHKKRFSNTESSTRYKFKGLKKNGDVIYIDISVSEIIKSNEGITGTISYLQDITERRISEEKIKRLAHTIESITESVSITDTSNNIVHVNRALLKLYGYSASELIGKTPDVLRAKQDEHVTQVIFAETKNENWTGEVWNKKKDGTIFPIELTTSSIKDEKGKTIALVGIGRDITQRKKAENLKRIMYNISQAVNITENIENFISIIREQLGTIVDTTNFYVAFIDEHTNTFSAPYMSDEKDNYTRIPVGKSLTGYLIKQNKPVLLKKDEILELNKLGKIDLIGTLAEVWLGVPLKIKNKVFGAFVVQSYKDKNAFNESDVEMLEFISNQLSISIERRRFIDDLEKALEKAKESDKLKTAFLTNMSHEIRTPMNGIVGFSKLLLKQDLTTESKTKFVSIINKSSQQLLRIIGDIMDISKIETGQLEVIVEAFSVYDLIDSIYNFFKPQFDSGGIELRISKNLPKKYRELKSDYGKINQVLNNFVSNALKFTGKGFVEIACYYKAGNVEFKVKDTGIGIEKSSHDNIFERFRQVETNHTRTYGGTGLGLSISKGFVQLLGGEIWLESVMQEGSAFYFSIPVKSLPVENIKTKTNNNIISKNTEINNRGKVLIVENEQNNLLFLQEVLFDLNIREIVHARNGIEAVEYCEKNDDLNFILMDLKMPVMSGLEVTRKIKLIKPDLPIIAQTAYSTFYDKQKAIDAGCDEYLTKPILIETVSKIIKKYI
ncbi:MAG: PAS domain S-box protein [Bacteroidales bacterium]|nr:PAS domain S-box protein [Bacteroidales bacterium]